MTGYTVHTGSTLKFSSSWDRIFQESESGKKSASDRPAKAAAEGKSAKKTAVKSAKKAAAKTAKSKPAKAAKKTSTAKIVKRGK